MLRRGHAANILVECVENRTDNRRPGWIRRRMIALAPSLYARTGRIHAALGGCYIIGAVVRLINTVR